MQLFHAALFLVSQLLIITSADPDPLRDFCIADNKTTNVFMNGLPCINPRDATGKHFTTSVLKQKGRKYNSNNVSVTAASEGFIPGINTMGMMMARIDIGVGGTLPGHSHPRASEICFVLQGTLRVGFYDTTNKLFFADIKTGDIFVFPKGLRHFMDNAGNNIASAIMAFNSQSPGHVIPYQG